MAENGFSTIGNLIGGIRSPPMMARACLTCANASFTALLPRNSPSNGIVLPSRRFGIAAPNELSDRKSPTIKSSMGTKTLPCPVTYCKTSKTLSMDLITASAVSSVRGPTKSSAANLIERSNEKLSPTRSEMTGIGSVRMSSPMAIG